MCCSEKSSRAFAVATNGRDNGQENCYCECVLTVSLQREPPSLPHVAPTIRWFEIKIAGGGTPRSFPYQIAEGKFVPRFSLATQEAAHCTVSVRFMEDVMLELAESTPVTVKV